MNHRHVVQICIRASVVLIGAYVFLALASKVLYHYPYGWGTFTSRPIFTLRDELVVVGPLVVIAGALWLFQSRLSRLIVPRQGRACPECDYDLRKLKGNRCPECGFDLPARPASRDGSST